MNTYEALFIFGTQLKDEELDAMTAKVTEDVTKLGGNVTATDTIGKRTFAHTMQKRDAGFYVRLHIEMDPAAVDALLHRYRLNEGIFRIQMTRVDLTKKAKQTKTVGEQADAKTVAETVA